MNPITQPARPLIAIVMPNLAGGGAERVHLELASEFIALGYAVEFVLLRKEGPLLAELPEGASVVGLGVANFRYALGPLRRYFRKRRPPFVMAAMWPLTAATIVAARTVRPRPRILVGEHIDFASGSREHRVSTMVMKRLGRMLYGAADAVVAVSTGVKTALAKMTGFAEDRIAVVYNPVRAPDAIPPLIETEATAWWLAARYRLVTAGRLTEQKDHATLVRAMALLPASLDARLLILGEGPEQQRLAALIDALGVQDRVRLGGFTNAATAFFDKASLLVMSSRWEGLPVVIIEALLQGLPIVSTDCPSGPAEILEGGRFGRLVPMQDPAALATAVAEALADPHAGNGLRERGTVFAPRRSAERYLRLLDPAFSSPETPAKP